MGPDADHVVLAERSLDGGEDRTIRVLSGVRTELRGPEQTVEPPGLGDRLRAAQNGADCGLLRLGYWAVVASDCQLARCDRLGPVVDDRRGQAGCSGALAGGSLTLLGSGRPLRTLQRTISLSSHALHRREFAQQGFLFLRPACELGDGRQRLRPHHIRLPLQTCVIIHRHAILHLHRRLYPALGLLDDVPGLVRQMLLLPGRQVDVAALGVGQGVELGGLGGVEVDLDVVQR